MGISETRMPCKCNFEATIARKSNYYKAPPANFRALMSVYCVQTRSQFLSHANFSSCMTSAGQSTAWCVKGTEESSLEVDSSVPLTHHDPKDLGLICLVKKPKVYFRIISDFRIQSWIFLKKRTLSLHYWRFQQRETWSPSVWNNYDVVVWPLTK